jgi:putative flippase GtrA
MEQQKYYLINNTFLRFSIIGVVSNIINFILYSLVYLMSFNIIVSSLVGYSVGILCSYYFARFWVFQLNNNFRFVEMIKFISVYIIGGLSMTFIIFCLNHYLNIDYRVSWIGGALFAIMNNYLGSKHLVFKKTNI